MAEPLLVLGPVVHAHVDPTGDHVEQMGLIYLATLIFVVGALFALRGILAMRRS